MDFQRKSRCTSRIGIAVCILEDQHGLILHHKVMEKETDDKVAVVMVDAARKKFPKLKGCSFDKGFYTPANKKELKTILDIVVPRKRESSIRLAGRRDLRDIHGHKRKHSAVESAINALENHGLDRCPDHCIDGFKRYVSLAGWQEIYR